MVWIVSRLGREADARERHSHIASGGGIEDAIDVLDLLDQRLLVKVIRVGRVDLADRGVVVPHDHQGGSGHQAGRWSAWSRFTALAITRGAASLAPSRRSPKNMAAASPKMNGGIANRIAA